MNETLLLMQMIKNGDLNSSSDFIVHSQFANIFGNLAHIALSSEVWTVINNIASSLKIGEFSPNRIIILDTATDVWGSVDEYYEESPRPVILTNFQRSANMEEVSKETRDLFICDIYYANPYEPQSENMTYVYGIYQGQALFWYEIPPKSANSYDGGYNRVGFNSSLGIDNIVVEYHIEPPE